MASFYTNENFPIKIAQYLREMGHDVLTSHDAEIVVCTQNPDLLQQASQIDKAVVEAGDMTGILIRINRK